MSLPLTVFPAGRRPAKDSMTLLHILLGAERGGCERDCYFLCKYLRENTNHEILVLGESGPMSTDWEKHTTRLDCLRVMTLPRRERVRQVRAALKDRKADGVLLWHGMAELPFLLSCLPADAGPVLIHGGNPATNISARTDLRYLVAERLWPHSRNPLYVCCSQYVWESFEHSRYLRRFRRCVVPNGVEHAKDTIHEPRVLPAGPENEVVLGMVARLDSIKDHPTLLRAFADVLRVVPGARLELAGSGEAEPSLRLLAEALLADDEHFYAQLRARLDGAVTARARLAALIEAAGEDADDCTLWIELWSQALRDDELRAAREGFDARWREQIAAIVRDGREAGEFGDCDPDGVALTLAALIDGLGVQVALADPEVSKRRLVETVTVSAEQLLETKLTAAEAGEPASP